MKQTGCGFDVSGGATDLAIYIDIYLKYEQTEFTRNCRSIDPICTDAASLFCPSLSSYKWSWVTITTQNCYIYVGGCLGDDQCPNC
jgi:hypothetical protein